MKWKKKSGRSLRDRECLTAGILSFLLPFLSMLVIFILKGIYPFGGRSFLSTDLYHQYMPFFCEFVRSVKAGEGLSFTWNVGIGSNFLALYVYYLASPLHWLGFLVPEAHIMEFLSYLVVVKIGLCGLTAFWYLSRRRAIWEEFPAEGAGRNDGVGIPACAVGHDGAVGRDCAGKYGRALLFSCFYALSGFLAAYNWNIMWLDCVILLPLIVLGLERLVREGKCLLYCVTLALSILTNYYISIMICIFLVLYFVFLYCTERHPELAEVSGQAKRHPGKGRVLRHVKPAALFAYYSLLAGGMAAILLIPEVCAIVKTDFGEMLFTDGVKSYFSVLDVLARHCLSVSVEKGLDHWPNIYCGTGVFLFLPLYVLNERIPARKRFGMSALAGFLLLGFSTNVLDFIWHGLNYPDSLPARQSFIYILLLLTMCNDACGSLDFAREKEKERILRVYLGAVGAILLVEKFIEHEDFGFGVEWLTLLFVTIYAVVLYLAYVHRGKIWRIVLPCVALAAVVAETGINTYNTSVSNVSREEYLAGQEDYKALYAWALEQEDGFWRMEKFTRKTKNDGSLAGYPTASVFSSTMNSAVKDMYEDLGMRYSKVFYGFDGATAFTSALLNIKYLFGDGPEYENSLYTNCRQSNEIYLYRAEATLPFGYVLPSGYDLPEGYLSHALRLQNRIVNDLGVEGMLFSRCRSDSSGDDVKYTVERDGIYYGLVNGSGTRKVRATGGMKEELDFNDLKVGSVLYLGQLHAQDKIRLFNNDKDDDSKNIAVDIYRLDEDVLKAALEVLSAQHLENVEYDRTHLAGELSLEEEGRLLLSVPCEAGWHVELNGEKVTPETFGGALMAFDLQPGHYTLEMHYVPEGMYAGMAVSAVSVLCFLGTVFFAGSGKRVSGEQDKEELGEKAKKEE